MEQVIGRMIITMEIISNIVMPCIYSFAASFAFSVQFNIRKKFMISAAMGGILSQFVLAFLQLNGISEMSGYFISAAAISAYSEVLARRLKVPVNMHLVVAVIPLVTGGKMYYSMVTLINGDINGFLIQTVETFGIAGAIAMGIFAVSSVFIIMKTIKQKRIKKLPCNKNTGQ